MADYTEDKKVLGLDVLLGSEVASLDGFVVGDASDNGKAKVVMQGEMLAALDITKSASEINDDFNKTNDNTDDLTEGVTKLFATSAEKTKLGYISVSQAVDLDSVESLAVGALQKSSNLSDLTDASTARTNLGINTTANQSDSADKRFMSDAQESALDNLRTNITVTQAVDLDAIESRVNELDASVILKGTWDASAGTFPGGGVAQAGWSYIVSVAGTVDSISFAIGDRAIAILDNASTSTYANNWFKADYTDQVLSVNGLTGAVTITDANLSTSDVTTNNATASKHGFLKKLSGTATDVLGGDGNFKSAAQMLTDMGQSGTNTGDQLTFKTIAVSGQSDVVADTTTDTLTLVAGTNVTLTTDAATDSITITASSSGGIEVKTASLNSTQTNYSISGVATSANTTTILRVTPTSSFKFQSIDTTSWENGKRLVIENATSNTAAAGRLMLIENNQGASGTKFFYNSIGVPLMLFPGDTATFEYDSGLGLLRFVGGNSFGSNPNDCFDVFSDLTAGANVSSGGAVGAMGAFAGVQSGGASGTFSNSFSASPDKAIGVVDISTLTATNSLFTVGTATANIMRFGIGCALGLVRMAPLTALSDGTNTYFLYAGFHDGFNGAPVDGAMWKYDQSAATVWRTSTISNSTETVNDASGFTVSITVMHYLGVFINGDGTNVDFFYSTDGDTWVFSNSHTTNIPTGTSRVFGFGATIRKTAGGTARVASVDLLGYRMSAKRGA